MKKIIYYLLAGSILFSCQSVEKKTENKPFIEATDHTTETKKSTAENFVLLPQIKEIKVLSSKKKESDYSGEQEVEADFGKGYKLYDKAATFSGVEWYSEKLEFKKDTQTLLVLPDKEGYITALRSRKFYPELPRLAQKGNKLLLIAEIIEMPNNSINMAYLFEDNKMIKSFVIKATEISDSKAIEAMMN